MYFTKKANHTVPRRDPKHIFHSNEPLIATLVLITYLYLKHDWMWANFHTTVTGNFVVLMLTYKEIQELESELPPMYLYNMLSFQLHSSPTVFSAL